jgi:hypothetical protein
MFVHGPSTYVALALAISFVLAVASPVIWLALSRQRINLVAAPDAHSTMYARVLQSHRHARLAVRILMVGWAPPSYFSQPYSY